ncbi:hypothetical protein FJT64_021327 [Amphibalanus amphitrite]|uniref:Fibrinogen C-terminal domain-containing protein n=1 Tax=Amphibalanus amphitrite TaxID=1232801 RepID=A0A6A4WU12_AMPAM|nr:hypothetical protein FJT64_021327 [Amphibalanus amphitrite]
MLLRSAALLCLASLAAAHSIPQPSAAAQQPSAAAQLSQLLGPVVEGAVSRALAAERAAQQQCAADAGQRALVRLEERLDQLGREVAEMQGALAAGRAAGTERSGEDGGQQPPETPPEERPESGPACERQPLPLPADSSPHEPPERRACARSCLQLRDQGGPQHDGVYWFTGMPVPVLCDFSHDGGGWTLLLTTISQHGWDPFSVRARNKNSPSLTENHSILEYGDVIRNLTEGGRFAYRIEAKAEQGRQRWGGIWFAPRHYSFVDETGAQTDVSLVRRFDDWDYKDNGSNGGMPWINTRGNHAMFPVLTTTTPDSKDWWGTLVTHVSHENEPRRPWISTNPRSSGTVLYWMKENINNV